MTAAAKRAETTGTNSLRLVGNRTVDGDLAYLTYQAARDA